MDLSAAMNLSAACPGTLHTDYIVHKDDLDSMEISEQNESLTEHIEFLHIEFLFIRNHNINNRSRNKRTEGARIKALAEGIEIGKQESADKSRSRINRSRSRKSKSTDFPNNLRWRQKSH